MIEVNRYDNRITISGHANYAEPGKDIVCAGVSILVQTLIESIEQLTPDPDIIKYVVSPGWVDIKHGTLLGGSATLVSSFFIGIKMIAADYPENVRLTEH